MTSYKINEYTDSQTMNVRDCKTNGYLETNGYHGNGTNGYHGNGTHGFRESQTFLDSIYDLLVSQGMEQATSRNSKVVEFKHPKELKMLFDLEIGDEPTSDEKLLKMCSDTIRYSVKTGHPHFFNQLYQGQNQYGLAGAWLTETLNTSQYTFEVAPVFTLMEQSVLQKMSNLVGFQNGDGIFCPGGSISNMYALNLARYHKFPQIKTEGMHALPKLCLFTSEQSHYSLKKGAALLGIGINNVRPVRCDGKGKMLPSDLEQQILLAQKEGYMPFMVNATGGTTVVGAYDPLDAIADVCQKYKIWLHVDACWGGAALLSSKHRHLLQGIHRVDSVSWNPHKMMGVPLQCCAFLTQHKGLLQEAHCANATYLFQQDKFYDVNYDTGDKSIQCGRKVDVFKAWLMWKATGNKRFEAAMDHIFDMSRYFLEKVKQTEGFRLVFNEPECTNVCFWYVPPSLRGKLETSEWREQLGKVAPKIKERMVYEGTMLIGYQPLGDLVNFFRLVVVNPEVSTTDMDFIIAEITRLGIDL